jgi:hypothetical protein
VIDTVRQLIKLTTHPQILSITCDNASPNDTMISQLQISLPNFPGESNQTRCFNHSLALVAIRIVRQFDAPTGGAGINMDEAEQELRQLAKGIDEEELITQQEHETDDDDEGEDNVDGWSEERDELSETDRQDLDTSLRPVRMLLVKVSV